MDLDGSGPGRALKDEVGNVIREEAKATLDLLPKLLNKKVSTKFSEKFTISTNPRPSRSFSHWIKISCLRIRRTFWQSWRSILCKERFKMQLCILSCEVWRRKNPQGMRPPLILILELAHYVHATRMDSTLLNPRVGKEVRSPMLNSLILIYQSQVRGLSS